MVLLVLAGGYWLIRGPARALSAETGSPDLRMIAASARGFVHGANPYDFEVLRAWWPASSEDDAVPPDWRSSKDLLYPPSSIILVAPIALLPWVFMKTAWVGVSTLALATSLMAFFRFGGRDLTREARFGLVALALVFAPVITTFSAGQTSLVTLSLIVGAHWARLSGVWWASGLMLGLASALKPQIGVVFLAYELFRLRWRAGAVGLATAGACFALAAIRLSAGGIEWLPSLRANVSAFMTLGRGDPTMANEMRYQLINLQVPLHGLTDDRAIVSLLVWAIVGGLALAYGLVWMRRREGRDELLTLSMACPLTLLLAYHRAYDAVLLLVPIVWALREIVRCRSAQARSIGLPLAALACCGVWILPSNSILFALESRQIIPATIADSTIYNLIVLPHLVWANVALAVVLIFAMAQRPKAPVAIFRREPSDDGAGGLPLASPTAPSPRLT